MGADLYLNSIFQPNFERYEALFGEWMERRDGLQKDGHNAEAKEAQIKVEEYHDKMYEQGYFRDSYNSSNVLWLFEVSWWEDVAEMMDDEGMMSPAYAQILMQMVSDRETIFEASLLQQAIWDGYTKEQIEHYFREKYKRFTVFLEETVRLSEAIVRSI